jgi:predicted dehydrogenase
MTADRIEISRRSFTATTTLTAAAVVAGGARRVLGANDRVVVAMIGIRGQGNALKQGFAKVPGVEIKTLCDIDENLFASRAHDPSLAKIPGFKPGYQKDMRRVFEDKDVDAVVIAMPNHWHALATIWALQARKHVFVEKPASHTVWEGRKMVEAAARYRKVVQVGTMNRSRPGVQQAIEFLHKGGIGKLHTARGLCFKPRPAIGRYPDGPITDGQPYRMTVESGPVPDGVWDASYLAKVDYDLWLGPAPLLPFNRNRFHYNWHWHWDYGNGDTGNQGPHQFDIARWGLGKNEHPVKVAATGGYFGPPASQETPDTHTSFFEYADGSILEFATRGEFTNDEGTRRIGNLFYGSKGWLWIDADGGKWQSHLGRKNEPGPGFTETTGKASSDPLVLTSQELLHYQNFVDAVRANDPKLLTSGIEEGHLSASLAHLANVSYRVGRQLKFDGATEQVVGDAQANALLTRTYRAPFVVPEKV